MTGPRMQGAAQAALLWSPNEYERRCLASGNYKVHRLGRGEVFVGRGLRYLTCDVCGGRMDVEHNLHYRVTVEGAVTRTGWYCQPTDRTPPSVSEFFDSHEVRRLRTIKRMQSIARSLFEVTLGAVKRVVSNSTRRFDERRLTRATNTQCVRHRRKLLENSKLTEPQIELVLTGLQYMVLDALGYGGTRGEH